MTESTNQHFDYIIIGAGTAGCVLANRLSRIRKNKYCSWKRVKDNYFWIDIPVGYVHHWQSTHGLVFRDRGRAV